METGRRSPQSYYSVLGVGSDSSDESIRRAYRKLAMQWHPDRWARNPSFSAEAKCRFQQIQEAYSVLSDKRKRTLYDAGFFDPNDEEDEGLSDFLQEMLSLMADVRREDKSYSLEELQGMLMEMAQDYEPPVCYTAPFVLDGSAKSKRARCEMNTVTGRHFCGPGLKMYEMSGYCN